MRLLGFVALWGMILMPMGAVIFMDFWVLPKLGLRSNFADRRRHSVQLGRRPRLVADDRRLHRAGADRSHPNLLRQPAGLVYHVTALRWPEQAAPSPCCLGPLLPEP